MENSKRLRPLSPIEKQFAEENYHLIMEFLKRSKLDAEEFYDIVVFDFLLSVEIYLEQEALRKKCCFEAVSYMYMRRAVYQHFRKRKAQKRSSLYGADISYEEIDSYAGIDCMENFSLLEYRQTISQIRRILTAEQQQIFLERLEGYSLKEIAEINGIKPKRVYRQFGRIKMIVAGVMENHGYTNNRKG